MAKLRKVQHLRSSVQGKYPTLGQVEYGEITVNFYQGDEFLCIRNKGIKGDGSDDAIVSFRTWPYIQKVIEANELVTASALATIKESCGFNVNGEYTPSATSKYISGVATITDALNVLDENLSQTYTKSEIDSKGYLTEVPSEYITESELDSKGYLTEVPSEYITESELDSKGYLTEVPSEYITENELNGKNYATVAQVENKQDTLTAGDGINITDNVISCTLDTSLYSVVTTLPTTGEANKIYLIKSEDSGDSNIYIEYGYIENSWEKLGEYKAEIDLSPYLTKSEASNTYATKATVEANELVTAAALTALNESCGFDENAEFAPSVDATYISEASNVTEALNVLDKNLSQTYTKNEIDSKGYLTEVPSEYITESELNSKGYLTEVPSEYITESEASNTYATKATVEANELVIAAALTALNESCGFNENAEFAPSASSNYISGASNVTEALNVLDENIPSIINLQTQTNSEWTPINYADGSTYISENNISFLQKNWDADLILSFIDNDKNTVYSRVLSKSINNNQYRCVFIVSGYYLAILTFDIQSSDSDIAWYKLYN